MSHYTIIPSDKAIYVDRVAVLDCDFSGVKVFHAIQWDGTSGHLEYIDASPNIALTEESDIEKYTGVSLSEFIARRQTALNAKLAAKAAAEAKAAAAAAASERE